LRARLNAGNNLFRAGDYTQAIQTFHGVFEAARGTQLMDLVARADGNIGSCQFALHQYQPALRSFLEAHRIAERIGDENETAALDTNIASLYSEIGDLTTAASWMQGTLERMSGEDGARHLPEILIQLATVRARQERMPEALDLFRRGIDGADRAGNLNLYALGWNRLGEEYLKRDDLPAAETALLEAYRVRKLNHLPLETSYRNLGRLRMRQGDLVSASHLLDRYVELAEGPQGVMPSWNIYLDRGRVRLAQGRLREALRDLRIAVRLARAWRWSAPSNDGGRVGAEALLDQVHAALIEAGNRLYLETHNPALIRETFEVAEENRASSLRAIVAGPAAETAGATSTTAGATSETPAYWEALLHLQRAEVQALRVPTPAAEDAVADARAELAHASAGEVSPALGTADAGGLTRRVQAALDSRSALLSFELGDSFSWLWAVDRSGLVLYSLPPRAQIERQISAANRALEEDLPDSTASGAALYRTLFGALAPRFQRKSRWVLALDQGEHKVLVYSHAEAPSLFDVPLAALAVETIGPRPVFVAERHSTMVVPGAGYWAESASRLDARLLSPVFVGVGDAIYNTADPRLPPARASRPARPRPLTASAAPSSRSLALPRLVASGAELDACARAWDGEGVLLKGAEASRDKLEEQLRRNPAVLHFATHFLPSGDGQASGLIALSLNRSGETELLAPVEIAHWKIHIGLVVLSGCRSAEGVAMPGTGLLGLTRAWLAAGARNVIGSRWSTPDDNGALFSALYRNLRRMGSRDAAESLRAAQVEMIQAGGWRAHPRYWGAYLAVGKQ